MLAAMMTDVNQFQREIQDLPCAPEPLQEHRHKFRLMHLNEELSEIDAANQAGDFEGTVDGYIDLIYVAMGALLEMGVTPNEAFGTVHDANMQKVRGMTKRGEAYDAIKPEGWEPPDHSALLAALLLRSQVSAPLLEATRVQLARAAKYNGENVRREDHFPFGMKSVYQMMHVKMMRMRADLDAGRDVDRDHLIDLINYSGFGVNLLDGRPM